jgi:hypothetical protein
VSVPCVGHGINKKKSRRRLLDEQCQKMQTGLLDATSLGPVARGRLEIWGVAHYFKKKTKKTNEE